MARRVLSELSGVSQRYLAQLENGGGNISIALLYRVANALDHRIEWLVGEEDPWSSILRNSQLYRSATAEQRQRVSCKFSILPAWRNCVASASA
ncbi:MAG: helix-turn-helix domain-containing protein [Nitratireductor sp.]